MIRIAVASDPPHFNHPTSPSHLNTMLPENLINQHPITALIDLIKRNNLTATALLSPGDLGHQADTQRIRKELANRVQELSDAEWQKLVALRQQMSRGRRPAPSRP
jgi:hypothetical protein